MGSLIRPGAMPPSEDHCWLNEHDQETVLLSEDNFKKTRWEDTLRPLSPGEMRRNIKRSHSDAGDRKPRPFDASPGRKFSSTVAWRNKMKEEIPYQPAEKRIRPVSCPPTPRARPKPEPKILKRPEAEKTRPKSPARVRIAAPEKQKAAPLPSRRPIDFPKIPRERDTSSPMPRKDHFSSPPVSPMPRKDYFSSSPKSPMPSSEARIDYDRKAARGYSSGSGSGSGGSSGGGSRWSRKNVKRTRNESLSGSYSSSNTVVHHYDGCQIM